MNMKNEVIEIVTQSTNEYILVLGELEKIDVRRGYVSGISSVVQGITGNKPIIFSFC